MKFSQLGSAPVRRSVLGLILVAVAFFPGGAGGHHGASCPARRCQADGTISWSRPLTGSWLTENGAEGTVYASGQAYAAVGDGVAALGFGLTLDAFDAATGFPRWAATLGGVPAGSQIISVRVWRGVVTAGVQMVATGGTSSTSGSGGGGGGGGDEAGGASGPAGQTVPGSVTGREEFVLDAVTGKQLRVYPAAWFGGAVSASRQRTVIVGSRSVTGYANATGRVIWRVATGSADQAWEVSGSKLYVTVSATGEAGTAPVTAVLQISLRTGVPRLVQPTGRRSFDGRLSGVLDGTLLFSGADGLRMYSAVTGRLTGFRAGAVPEIVDSVDQVLYVDIGGTLFGIDPVTGLDDRGTAYPGPPGTYGVRDGVALGLDPGASGAVWGYNIARKHVSWTTRSLPWPHFFVDPSGLGGLGGSTDPGGSTVLLVTCRKVGHGVLSGALAGGSGNACLRPVLVAIQR